MTAIGAQLLWNNVPKSSLQETEQRKVGGVGNRDDNDEDVEKKKKKKEKTITLR